MLASLIFVCIGYIFCVLYTDITFDVQVFTKPNDAKALKLSVKYYERLFAAPFYPVGVLLSFGVTTGGTIFNLVTKGSTTLRIISLLLLIAP